MGYRISLYRCPKETVDKVKNISNEEFDEENIISSLKTEEIKYDTLANVLDTGEEIENNLCSKLFTNKLDIEEDMSFYTISKEQLINIIEYIRKNNIYEYGIHHIVDYDKKDFSNFIGRYGYPETDWNEAVRLVCLDSKHDVKLWDYGWKNENGEMTYMNIDLSDNKWWISNAMSYKYSIFNFIHILKIFDWENDYLIAIGG